jgi:hypothetical protein
MLNLLSEMNQMMAIVAIVTIPCRAPEIVVARNPAMALLGNHPNEIHHDNSGLKPINGHARILAPFFGQIPSILLGRKHERHTSPMREKHDAPLLGLVIDELNRNSITHGQLLFSNLSK